MHSLAVISHLPPCPPPPPSGAARSTLAYVPPNYGYLIFLRSQRSITVLCSNIYPLPVTHSFTHLFTHLLSVTVCLLIHIHLHTHTWEQKCSWYIVYLLRRELSGCWESRGLVQSHSVLGWAFFHIIYPRVKYTVPHIWGHFHGQCPYLILLTLFCGGFCSV